MCQVGLKKTDNQLNTWCWCQAQVWVLFPKLSGSPLPSPGPLLCPLSRLGCLYLILWRACRCHLWMWQPVCLGCFLWDGATVGKHPSQPTFWNLLGRWVLSGCWHSPLPQSSLQPWRAVLYPKFTGTWPPMPPTKPRRAFSWEPWGAFCGQNSGCSAIAQTRAGVSISWAEPGLGCAGSRPTPHGDWQGGVCFQYNKGCTGVWPR